MNIRFHIRWFNTIQAQIMLLVFSTMILVVLFYKPLKEFRPIGKESFIMDVTPDVIQKWGQEPTKVKTGFVVNEFLQFDVIKNSFLMNAIISFEFDPSKVSLETIDKFSFTKGDIIQKSDPLIKKLSESRTFVEYRVRIQFSTMFDYALFPLDDHQISLNFTNTTVEAQNIIFEVAPEDFSVPEYVYLSGWRLVSHQSKSGYTRFQSQRQGQTHYPKIVFSLDIKKEDIRQLLLIMIPLLILFYFCVFSLSIKSFNTKVEGMFPLLTAYMAYVIVIQAISPAVSYFMLMDYMVLYFLIAMFFICLVNFLTLIPEDELSRMKVETIKGMTILMVHASLLLVMYYVTRIV